jgi:hypothetical protein
MDLADFEKRAAILVNDAAAVLAGTKSDSYANQWVDTEAFAQLRSASLSFLRNTFGVDHSYYKEFDKGVTDSDPTDTRIAKGILEAARSEVAGGWSVTTIGIVSASIFADFLEMAQHLLDSGYKDAAAVMTGSVLEEQLRQLANKYAVPIEHLQSGKLVPSKADTISADLVKAQAYNKLDAKNVTAWLDLRNKAAHGLYAEYTKEQVVLMHQGVSNFMARNII